MAASKIAPTLRWHIQEPFGSDPAALRDAAPQMAAELRALLRVARAAERLLTVGDCGRDVCGTGIDPACPSVIRAEAALRSLRRASGARSRKGGR